MRTRSSVRFKTDIAVFILLPIIAAMLSFMTNADFTISMLFFMGLPAVWLVVRMNKTTVKNVTIYTLLTLLPLSLIVEYIAEVSGAWVITGTVLNFRIFNVIEIDVLVWGWLFGYLVLLFYEFTNHENRILNWRAFKWGIVLIISFLIIFFVLQANRPEILSIPYAYAWLLLLGMVLPLGYMAIKNTEWLRTLVPVTFYVFCVSIVYELVGLSLNQWTFPSAHVLTQIPLFGFTIPLEEFLWFILAAPSVVVWYTWFTVVRQKRSGVVHKEIVDAC